MKRTLIPLSLLTILAAPAAAQQMAASAMTAEPSAEGIEFFEKKIRPALVKAVVGSFQGAFHADLVLVDDVAVGLGVALPIVHVPSEELEEGIEVIATELGLLVGAGLVGVEMFGESGDEVVEGVGRGRVERGRGKGKRLVRRAGSSLQGRPALAE